MWVLLGKRTVFVFQGDTESTQHCLSVDEIRSHVRVSGSVKSHAFFLSVVIWATCCMYVSLCGHFHANVFNEAVLASRHKHKLWKVYQENTCSQDAKKQFNVEKHFIQSPKTLNASCIRVCNSSPLLSSSSNPGPAVLSPQQKQNEIWEFISPSSIHLFIPVFWIHPLFLFFSTSSHTFLHVFSYLSCSLYRCMSLVGEGKGPSEAGGQEGEEQPDLLLILPSLFFTVSLQGGHCLPAGFLSLPYFVSLFLPHTHTKT